MARQHPTRAVYQVALGLLTKDADQADAYYTKALALDPRSARAHFLLAGNADSRGDWDGQRKHLKAAVENNPDEPRYLMRYAAAHRKSDPNGFRELALQVVARFPTSPVAAEALYNLADASSNPERRGVPGPASRKLSGRSLSVFRLRDEHAVRGAHRARRGPGARARHGPGAAGRNVLAAASRRAGGDDAGENAHRRRAVGRSRRATREGAASVRQPRHDMDAVEGGGGGRGRQSGKGVHTLVESAAASPDTRIDAALPKYSAGLGKTSRDVEAGVWGIRDARAKPAAAFSLPSVRDGAAAQLADFRGRVVLLAFWYPT